MRARNMSTASWTIQLFILTCLGVHTVLSANSSWTITPANSIQSGGIMVTISGSDLDDNVTYSLNLRSVSGANVTSDSPGVCNRVNGSLQCMTPRVDLSKFMNPNNSNSNNPEPFQFYAFLKTIQTPVDTIDTTSVVRVYLDPKFTPFKTNVSFTQGEGNTITIQSQDDKELLGFTAGDVYIQIDAADTTMSPLICDNVKVDKTQITCTPPSIDPAIIRYKPKTVTFPVQIRVGEADLQLLGDLTYGVEQVFSIIIIVMIVVLGLIVIVSVIIGMLTVCGCECSCCSDSSEPDQMYLTPEEPDYTNLAAERAGEPSYDKPHSTSYAAKMSRAGRYKASWSPEDSTVDMSQGRIKKRGDDNFGFSG